MITLKYFPTHIERTQNKIKSNKFIKINNQSIYNGAITRFSRAIVINNIHKWILSELQDQDLPKINDPVKLVLRFYTVRNHNTIKRIKEKIQWKPPEDNYIINWDEDNLRGIWEKTIKDCLTKLGVWPDDTAYYCRGIDSEIIFVDHIEERKIEIDFKSYG